MLVPLVCCDSLVPFLMSTRFCMVMAHRTNFHEDQSQEAENKRLNCPNEHLKRNEHNGCYNWQQESEDRQEDTTGEDVSEETERERDQATQLTDDFKQPDHEVNETHWAFLQSPKVEILAQLTFCTQDRKAEELRCDN